ncbi:hypothetical protein MXL97_01185 [Mammaliicoccus fleurettii]|nr:hypothetical protein [Mammaliicoccus fleurettii]MEB6200423.1 hypothetical protein [Mammaliicoccus fleurettii]
MGYLTYPKLLLPQIDSFNIPIDHKSYTNVIEFGDKVLIDGDLFQANGDINGKSYKVFYKLKNEHEKNKLLNTMPFMKNCIITYNKTITLPNTNNLKFNYNEYLLEHEIDGVLKLKNFSVGSCKKRYLNVIEKGQLYRERLIQNL